MKSWALNNRKENERIFYVLPYQASINAMVDTLVRSDNGGYGFGEASVGMLHHNALSKSLGNITIEKLIIIKELIVKQNQHVEQTQKF